MDETLAATLQKLRDIHEPAIPSWWPPAWGWWIFAASILFIVVLTIWYIWKFQYGHRVYWSIRRAARKTLEDYASHRLDDRSFANRINVLYKYLLIDVENRSEAVPAFGTAWQEMLHDRFDEPDFVTGAGRSLGTIRFTTVPYCDPHLKDLVERTLCVVRPPSGSKKTRQ